MGSTDVRDCQVMEIALSEFNLQHEKELIELISSSRTPGLDILQKWSLLQRKRRKPERREVLGTYNEEPHRHVHHRYTIRWLRE